ncbi:hypothetical protein [Actinomycetospora straminea]|uniref:Uncharacterized protein n=1 Tax=Actinomycetospora straminea TaxID=663607 RepID=A0ABP9EAL9_9PSEU|nr:hypothetical protein [Actinomycetospora straminea]MDD7932168.1 hypothetical protein [Actinomycetospora straminea]
MTTTQETDSPPPGSGDPDEAEAPETLSRQKRLGISVLIVLVLLGMLASVAPKSQLREELRDITRPFLLASGVDQGWGVFSPSPPTTTNLVVARVDRADGTVGVYPMEGGVGIAEYWDYRWRKYAEQMWRKRGAERERIAFAGWIADQDRAAGHEPVRVTLLRHTRQNLPPGPGPDAGEWREIPFFTTPASRR